MKQHMQLAESSWAHMKLTEWANTQDISVLLVESSSGDAIGIIQAIVYGEPLYNFKIERKASLTEGIDFLKNSRVDVVLLDLNVPDANESEAIGIVHGLFPELPIVVISNSSDTKTIHHSLRNGAQKFLSKEKCNSIALRESICEAISHKKMEISYCRGDKL